MFTFLLKLDSFLHTIYSDYSLKLLLDLSTSPTQIHTFSFLLESKQINNNNINNKNKTTENKESKKKHIYIDAKTHIFTQRNPRTKFEVI